jgi:hypothetical protein
LKKKKKDANSMYRARFADKILNNKNTPDNGGLHFFGGGAIISRIFAYPNSKFGSNYVDGNSARSVAGIATPLQSSAVYI